MAYVMRLSNGRELRDVNNGGGNTWTTSEGITKEYFADGLETVIVSGPEPEEGSEDVRGTYRGMKLANIFRMGNRWGFVLSEESM